MSTFPTIEIIYSLCRQSYNSTRDTCFQFGMLQIVLCAILILHGDVSLAKPLDPEDLEGLLPPTPQDKNETIAAIVQDPVVQDAVQQTASNSSLNGLVVKRKVYILPANDPNKVRISTRCTHGTVTGIVCFTCQHRAVNITFDMLPIRSYQNSLT